MNTFVIIVFTIYVDDDSKLNLVKVSEQQKGETMLNKSLVKKSAGAVAGVAAAALVFGAATGTAFAATALTGNEYLEEYEVADGLIEPQNGNHSGYDGEACRFSWRAQSVTDLDLDFPEEPYKRGYAVNGFIESVRPVGDSAMPGSGWAEIQHFFLVNTDTLIWRMPIALDHTVVDAQLNMVFDDDDWTVNPSTYEQYSTWPGFPSSFNRFMGDSMGEYPPHDDNLVLPAVWGVDTAGNTTLSVSLGSMEAGTSTILSVAGSANDGNAGILSGTSYGAKFTLEGTLPFSTCLMPSYGYETLLTGSTGELQPAVGLTPEGSTEAIFPVGTTFELEPNSPAGVEIDHETGLITWTVPGDFPVGEVTIPVMVTYPDTSTGEAVATVTVVKNAAVGPFEDQVITLGESIEDVLVELRDHLGNGYGDGAELVVTGLPEGVVFDATTGLVSGVPAEAGEFSVNVSGVDADGEVLVAADFTITVLTPTVTEPGGEPGDKPGGEPEEKPAAPGGGTKTPAPDKLATTGGMPGAGIAGAGVIAALLGCAFLIRRAMLRKS